MNVDEHERRASVEVETQQFGKAIDNYRLSLGNQPERKWLLNDIAWCYFSLQKYDLALSTCEEALSSNIEPNYKSISYLWKGKTLEKMGMVSEALECFDRGLALECYSVNLLWAKGHLLASLGQSNEANTILQECRDTLERETVVDEALLEKIQTRKVQREKLLESIETDIQGIISVKSD